MRTGAEDQSGTGYDEHCNVKTSFGRWPISYDPVTGTATTNVTAGYDFPAGVRDPAGGASNDFGGLVDVSATAAGHSQMMKEHKEADKEDKNGGTGPGGG